MKRNNNNNNTKLARKAKADGQQIQNLQRKLHQEKLKSRVRNANRPDTNCSQILKNLTMAVINPKSVKGLRYPDAFSEGTSAYKSKQITFLPINDEEDLFHWPVGAFYVQVRPELENTVCYIDKVDDENNVFADGHIGDNNNGLYGFYDSKDQLGGATAPITLVIPPLSSVKYDVVLPVSCAGVPQDPVYWEQSDGAAVPGWYYLPCKNWTLTDIQSFARCLWRVLPGRGGTLIDVDMILRQRDINGTLLSSTAVNRTSPGETAMELNLDTTTAGFHTWKLELEITNTETVSSVALYHKETQLFYEPHSLRMYSFPLQDFDNLKSEIEKFRVTAQSMLISYYGASLTDAGFIAAHLFRGGHSATMESLVDYSSIANHPSSYDGTLKLGTYGYWEPMDITDMEFRCPFRNTDPYKIRPYLISAGVYNGDSTGVITAGQILRLEVITQIEFTSKSQTYDVIPSPVCPEALVDVARITSGVPNCMENGKHIQKLKQIAAKAGKMAMSLGSFAWAHRAQIAKLAEHVAPVLTAL